MKKREANFGIEFRHFLKKNPQCSSAFELKQTTTDNINFSCISENQINYLRSIKSNNGTLIRVVGGGGEPDYIYLRNEEACIVISFPKGFVIIDIEKFILEKEKNKEKSLHWDRAKQIAKLVYCYKISK